MSKSKTKQPKELQRNTNKRTKHPYEEKMTDQAYVSH